jgi:integrase
MNKKSKKGSVSISNFNEKARLRWRYKGHRYSLTKFEYNDYGIMKAKKLALEIEIDILEENFDTTLSKYSGFRTRGISATSNSTNKAVFKNLNRSIVEHFEHWVQNYRHMNCESDVDYYSLRNTIRRWGRVDENNMLQKLNTEKYNPGTYNRKLGLLKLFTKWLFKHNIWSSDPLEDVMKRKARKTVKAKRLPFTTQEITSILEAIKHNTFSPKESRYTHSHYYPFIYFLFKTGVRPAEAIGLRVGSVDVGRKVIHIKEVLARTVKGTNASARVRKETKNGKERMLPLTEDLLAVIQPLLVEKDSDALVFQSFSGGAIDDRMFLRRVFKPVLKSLEIADKDLYACRHTFGSRCIDQGMSPVMTAFLMGNNPETALRNYTHQITLPKDLPEI